MKKNPYRLIETVLAVLLVLMLLGMVGSVVHLTSSWRGFGLCVGITLLFILGMVFLSWWAQQRDGWDKKHPIKPGETK